MTADEYRQIERARASEFAPPEDISQQEFVYRASFYPLPVLRLAAMRYISARGRSYSQVLATLVERLNNPHANRDSDTYAVALGHIEATRRQMAERGMQ